MCVCACAYSKMSRSGDGIQVPAPISLVYFALDGDAMPDIVPFESNIVRFDTLCGSIWWRGCNVRTLDGWPNPHGCVVVHGDPNDPNNITVSTNGMSWPLFMDGQLILADGVSVPPSIEM